MSRSDSKIRVGLLGAANIAIAALIEPARRRDDVELVAVAARDLGKAQEYARKHGFAEAMEGYEALINRDDIDLIYNALIPSRHMDLSCKALEAGKHVLVEKPFALNVAETDKMLETGAKSGRFLIEAFHDHYHPVLQEVMRLVQGGSVGTVRSFRAQFDVAIPFEASPFRHTKEMGGGALMDLGCYPVHWATSLLRGTPEVLEASATLTPTGVDESLSAKVRFGDVVAELGCNMAEEVEQRAFLDLVGDKGRIYVDNPILPHNGHYIETEIDGIYRRYTMGAGTTYDHQLEAVLNAIRTGTPAATGGNAPRIIMQVVQDMYEAAGMDRSF
ncbi:Gfo/Idh/MocA family protein [Maritalea myrionectae]|uniref:Gfo/Idh/MocA family protein n=1 Tax=Maritalea myrionectae TaxID=454601 RepID=UPI000409EA24|nr:Gfo/Idh/MocA family oxidoreductase [Maritalea myrionectae]